MSTLRALSLALLFALSVSALSDGLVTQPAVADPVETWKIADLRFPLLQSRSAIVTIAYIRESGAVDHLVEHTFAGADYEAFLESLNTSAGAGEAECVTDVEGSPVVDRACIFNFRLSHWMVSTGKIEGVTAEPTTVE